MFKFPSMHFPAIHFPKFPKIASKDFAGGQATMSTTEFHCVNGTCDGKVNLCLFSFVISCITRIFYFYHSPSASSRALHYTCILSCHCSYSARSDSSPHVMLRRSQDHGPARCTRSSECFSCQWLCDPRDLAISLHGTRPPE